MATLLGLPGAWADVSAEAATHYTTKAGGLPDWPPGAEALGMDEQLSCKACGRRLGLVVQAYAPLHVDGREVSERTLYVFGCLAPDCGCSQDSWRVFRLQGQDAGIRMTEPTATVANLDTSLDHGGRDDGGSGSQCQDASWSSGAETTLSSQKKEEQDERKTWSKGVVSTSSQGFTPPREVVGGRDASAVGLGSDGQEKEPTVQEAGPPADEWAADDSWGASTWQSDGPDALNMSALSEAIAQVADSANKRAAQSRATSVNEGDSERRSVQKRDLDASDASSTMLPCFYIVAGEERIVEKKEKAVKAVVDEAPQGESWEGEGYEYDSAVSADRTFLRFRKRLEEAPEQCIRYGFKSKPLLARALSDPPPDCPACGAPRTVEMQLMPPLPYFFAEASDKGAEHVAGWEWLTLLVYTCSKACHPTDSSTYTAFQEHLVYQHELDSPRASSAAH